MRAVEAARRTGQVSMEQACKRFGLHRDAYYKLKRRMGKQEEVAAEVVELVKVERMEQPRQGTRKLLTTLPDSLQKAVLKAESTQNFADTEYQEAMNVFYDMYVWRKPVKEDLDSMYATFNVDLYNYMWGPSEFTATGTLKDYDGVSFLPQIKVPVMFTVGEFDEIDPALVKDLSQKVPNSKYVMFKGAAHMTPWDAREESLRVVREFLQSVESSR